MPEVKTRRNPKTFPDPLTPPDSDLRNFPFVPIDIARLFGSEFHALSSDAEWRAGITLWLKSFHQTPAGSLPDNDVALCRLAELGVNLKQWKLVKRHALRNWAKCSDGRLYHHVVAEKVHTAVRGKRDRVEQTEAAREARRLKRQSEQQNAVAPATISVTGAVTESNREGDGDLNSKESNVIDLGVMSARATALLDRFAKTANRSRAQIATKPALGKFDAAYDDWVAAGCDPESDIWPTIGRMTLARELPDSPQYFTKAICITRDTRRERETERETPQWASPEEWRSRVFDCYLSKDHPGLWPANWGPAPDQPGTLVPAEILALIPMEGTPGLANALVILKQGFRKEGSQ